jgi:cytoskeletal protein CcmA (bactofilin family)
MTWLGQKPDQDQPRPTPQTAASPQPIVHQPNTFETPKRMEANTVANIGKSLHIKGELSGSEDLTIDGKVEGKITLNGQHVTIGPNGHVTAEIHAKSVIVGGQMKGNVIADDRVEIAATGSMLGDVRAPRVVLVDGARFKGSIDMDGKTGATTQTTATTATRTTTGATAPAGSEVPAYAGAAKS